MKWYHEIAFRLPSLLYGAAVWLRNWLFDRGLLTSRQFAVPTICVGNIAVGGTGKTPHIEYLVRMFGDKKVAVLSRGYKRQTRGFVLADTQSTVSDIGDEPLQLHRKFPHIIVAVDERRTHGIEQLLTLPEAIRPEIILLDDAMQHRYVRATLTIALVDCHRAPDHDALLPLGRLREPLRALHRAQCVIITKQQAGADFDEQTWRKRLRLDANQTLFGSWFAYDTPQPLTASTPKLAWNSNATDKPNLLVVTGIAAPHTLHAHVQPFANQLATLAFADHHQFTANDLRYIADRFSQLAEPKAIITTEKDAARLMDNPLLPPSLQQYIHTIGIRVELSGNAAEQFEHLARAVF